MIVSRNWLQAYFEQTLPDARELARLLTFHSFEVEEVRDERGDWVLEIDVLPNRTHDCLSHYGVAKELSAILNLPLKLSPLRSPAPQWGESKKLGVAVGDAQLCPRYSAAVVEGVNVGPSPGWLVRRLEAIGQKSINNIVDAANYVMFDLGQPLHVFDKGKLQEKGGNVKIGVRTARRGETIQTLDGEEYELGVDALLITDANTDNAIGMAGVKGGANSGVDQTTTDVVVESANFDQTSIRKTSRGLGIHTDAAKRFEQGLSPETTMHALREMVALVHEIAGGDVEGAVDVYSVPAERREVKVKTSRVNKLLGTNLRDTDIAATLVRLGFTHTQDGEQFTVTVPLERLDVTVEEDLVEEIGRIVGFENVPTTPLPKTDAAPEIDKHLYYASKTRGALADLGFSEVYTYAFVERGDVELQNAIARDKAFLRPRLEEGVNKAVKLNAHSVDFLGLERIQIFELGKVYTSKDEHNNLAIAVWLRERDQSEQEKIFGCITETLERELGVKIDAHASVDGEHGYLEFNFDEFIEGLSAPGAYEYNAYTAEGKRYQKLSPYPFVLRDIAVWMPEGTPSDELLEVIEKEGGELFVSATLFDEFKKADRVSYAFRIVFQSHEKTLTDEETNEAMEQINRAVSGRGWEAR